MKRVALIALVALTACSPKPIDTGWEATGWRYTQPNQKVCGELLKYPARVYQINVFDNDGKVIYSNPSTFASDQEAKTFFESVCDKRER